MADQCIVCLEPLDVVATPLAPAEQELQKALRDQHERLVREDPDALSKINQTNTSEPANPSHVAEISACGHTLHDECLRGWSEKANSCPICRQTFNVVTVFEKVGGEFATPSPTACTSALMTNLFADARGHRPVLVDPLGRGQEAGTRIRSESVVRRESRRAGGSQRPLSRLQLGRQRRRAPPLRRLRCLLPHVLHRAGQRPCRPLVLHGVHARIRPRDCRARRRPRRPDWYHRIPLLLFAHPRHRAAGEATSSTRRVAGGLGPHHGSSLGCARAGPRLRRRRRLGRL